MLMFSWISEHGPFSDELLSRHEEKKVAFYLNAYNALVMYAVLENMSPFSPSRMSMWGFILSQMWASSLDNGLRLTANG